MSGLINQLFKGLFMFGLPLLTTFCVLVLLDPATFWQTLTALIFVIIIYFAMFVSACLILNEVAK
jgi:hypothetical protein